MSNRGNGTRSSEFSALFLAAVFIALGAVSVRANDLDWLLYKPNTDYLNHPNRQPGYREPGDPPYVPEPLPAPPVPGGRSAAPFEEPDTPRSSARWRKGMLACEVVRTRIAAAGYTAVRAVDCAGEFYGYTATQGKARIRISARARDGVIISKKQIKN